MVKGKEHWMNPRIKSARRSLPAWRVRRLAERGVYNQGISARNMGTGTQRSEYNPNTAVGERERERERFD
jgi:hypothetical protein